MRIISGVKQLMQQYGTVPDFIKDEQRVLPSTIVGLVASEPTSTVVGDILIRVLSLIHPIQTIRPVDYHGPYSVKSETDRIRQS